MTNLWDNPVLQLVLADRNAWMAAVFLGYVALAFVFAAGYYALYRRNPRVFSFNADIMRGQSRSEEIRWSAGLTVLQSQLADLALLKRELDAATAEPAVTRGGVLKPTIVPSAMIEGATARFTFARIPAAVGVGDSFPPLTSLDIEPRDGSAKRSIPGREAYAVPRNLADYRALCDRWIADWSAEKQKLERLLATLATDLPEVWSYWDFLYFSGITQFTVGYGDILPNATSVRLIVLVQTLIAAALLVVVINLAFAPAPPATPPPAGAFALAASDLLRQQIPDHIRHLDPPSAERRIHLTAS